MADTSDPPSWAEAFGPVPPTGNRFATVTLDDHSAYVWVAALLSLVYAVLTFMGRIYIKFKYFGPDDWILVLAMVFGVAQYIDILDALSNGLGKSLKTLSGDERIQVGKAVFASQPVFVASLCLSKCSVLLLIRRLLTPEMRTFWRLQWCILGTLAAWGIASILALVANCSPVEVLMGGDSMRCPNQLLRWRCVAAFDVITEAMIVLFPVYIVMKLRMRPHLKIKAISGFAFRIPVAVLALVHVHAVNTLLGSPNPGVHVATPIVWQQVELSYALIAATIPCSTAFLKSFNTGLVQLGRRREDSYISSFNRDTGGSESGASAQRSPSTILFWQQQKQHLQQHQDFYSPPIPSEQRRNSFPLSPLRKNPFSSHPSRSKEEVRREDASEKSIGSKRHLVPPKKSS